MKRLVSRVAHHPYLALFAYFDHAQAVGVKSEADRTTKEAFAEGIPIATTNPLEFAKQCASLAVELQEKAKHFPCELPAEELQPYLFRPLCLATLGSSDDVTVTLIDNFMAAARLTSVATGIERSELMLCPKISTLATDLNSIELPEQLEARLHYDDLGIWPFSEPHEFFGEIVNAESTNRASPLVMLSGPPLCVVSSLKANLLSIFPNGLVMQECIYGAILRTVRTTVAALFRTQQTHSRLYSEEDVLSLRCLLLEPQGTEDYAVACLCSNYCIATTILQALRELTLGDVAAFTPEEVAWCIDRSDLHTQFVQIAREQQKNSPLTPMAPPENATAPIESLKGNHIFMRSYSTLCFSYEVLRGTRDDVRGLCEAVVHFNVSPGHEAHVRRMCRQAILFTFGNPIDRDETVGTHSDELDAMRGIVPGTHDLAIPIVREGAASAWINTADFFRFLAKLLSHAELTPQADDASALCETGYLDITSSLTTAIPRTLKSTMGPNSPESRDLLWRKIDVKSHLFGVWYFGRIRTAAETQLGIVDLLKFRKTLRRIGCPTALQYSLLYMLQEFYDCLADPLRCDAVLDLHDPVSMLLAFLAADGPAARTFPKIHPDWSRRAREQQFFAETTSPFKEYIDALLDAFTLRIQRAIPHHDYRDTAFNMRFGASKLIAAMDVPLKCCIGLYRMLHSEPEDRHVPKNRYRFGAVTTINTRQNTSISFDVWPEREGSKSFAFVAVDMDVFHLFRPEQGFYFLHETAHLFWKDFEETSGRASILRFSCDSEDHLRRDNAKSRTSEVFADLLSSLFVFGGDCGLFGRFHGLSFSESAGRVIRASTLQDETKFQLCLIEVAVRGFLVTELIDTLPKDVRSNLAQASPDTHPRLSKPQEAKAVFQRLLGYLKENGCFYRDLYPFWEPQNHDKKLAKQLLARCAAIAADLTNPASLESLAIIWERAAKVWSHYWKNDPALEMLACDPQILENTDNAIRECFEGGCGLVRSRWAKNASSECRFKGLDGLFILARMIRQYIGVTAGNLKVGKELFVDEDADGATVRPDVLYNQYLMTDSNVPLLAFHPKARRAKLLAQISYLKTLWDISTQIRSRRLIELGVQVLPKH